MLVVKLIEFNELLDRKSTGITEKQELKFKCVTEDSIKAFANYLSAFNGLSKSLNSTDDYKEFFSSCPILDAVIPDNEKEDLFYEFKLGYFYRGVPCKLVYILQKALMKYDSPNVAISAINQTLITPYVEKNLLPEGVSVKDIVCNLINSDFKLLTSSNIKVKYKDWYEVYISGSDRVAIFTEDIAKLIDNRDDIRSIEFDPQVGLVLKGIPIRTMAGHLGILSDEYDMRTLYECSR